jgi:hypothetical protein
MTPSSVFQVGERGCAATWPDDHAQHRIIRLDAAVTVSLHIVLAYGFHDLGFSPIHATFCG